MNVLLGLLNRLLLTIAGENVVVDSGKFGLRSSGKMAIMDASGECSECCGDITTITCNQCDDGLISEYYQIDFSTGFDDSPGGCTGAECDTAIAGSYVIGPFTNCDKSLTDDRDCQFSFFHLGKIGGGMEFTLSNFSSTDFIIWDNSINNCLITQDMSNVVVESVGNQTCRSGTAFPTATPIASP